LCGALFVTIVAGTSARKRAASPTPATTDNFIRFFILLATPPGPLCRHPASPERSPREARSWPTRSLRPDAVCREVSLLISAFAVASAFAFVAAAFKAGELLCFFFAALIAHDCRMLRWRLTQESSQQMWILFAEV
jgi:hypothetical protein